MKTARTYKTHLGPDRPIRNFRRFKKELKKLIEINPKVLNLLRRKTVKQCTAGIIKTIKIKGFVKTNATLLDETIIQFCYSIPSYKENYVTSSLPSDYRMQKNYNSPNYISKF